MIASLSTSGAATVLLGCALAMGLASALFEIRNRRVRRRWRQLTGQTKQSPLILWHQIQLWLSRKRTAQRSTLYLKKIPNLFDLIAMGLSCGLNFEQAFEGAVQLTPDGLVKDAFRPVLDHLRLGRSREVVIHELKNRLNVSQANGAFALILHSVRHGSPLQNLLFDQAAAMRREWMRLIERRAQTLGIRLLFPIMIFIFPTIFLLLFGMIYLSVVKTGSFL